MLQPTDSEFRRVGNQFPAQPERYTTPLPAPSKPDPVDSKQLLIQRLQGKIRRAETTGRNDDGTIVSSGSPAIDNLLPAAGYNRGTIIEWLADNGSSATFLSLLAAKNAAHDGGALVIIDCHGQFYPPAARAIGINLSNLIVLRRIKEISNRLPEYPEGDFASSASARCHSTKEDFLWSIEQSLRCSAVAAVWGELPDFDTSQDATRWLRRFQLSAESSGCMGMFMRKSNLVTTLNSPSWSEIQWHLQPLRNSTRAGDTRRVRASLVRCRGGTTGRSIDLEINTITGNVRHARRENATRNHNPASPLSVAAKLAHPEAGRRPA